MSRNQSTALNQFTSLDLHGYTSSEAVSTLELHISNCIINSIEKTEIIHGFGSGVLKRAVHEKLGQLDVVKSFQVCEFNRGVTKVYLIRQIRTTKFKLKSY